MESVALSQHTPACSRSNTDICTELNYIATFQLDNSSEVDAIVPIVQTKSLWFGEEVVCPELHSL